MKKKAHSVCNGSLRDIRLTPQVDINRKARARRQLGRAGLRRQAGDLGASPASLRCEPTSERFNIYLPECASNSLWNFFVFSVRNPVTK